MQRSISMDAVKELAKSAPDQGELIYGIYGLVFPDFDKIAHIVGHPLCSPNTWAKIFKICAYYDREHHPNLLPGGAWMNWGFGSADSLPDDVVETGTCSIEYRVVEE